VQLDDLGLQGILLSQRIEQVADHDHLVGGDECLRGGVTQLDACELPAVLDPPLLSRPLDKDPPHGLGRRSQEVPAAFPLLVRPDEAEIGLVHQVGALQRSSRRIACQLPSRQSAKLVVNDGQKLISGLHVPLVDPFNELRHVIHEQRAFADSGHSKKRFSRAMRRNSAFRRILNQGMAVVCTSP
jgi:hypothetical protein